MASGVLIRKHFLVWAAMSRGAHCKHYPSVHLLLNANENAVKCTQWSQTSDTGFSFVRLLSAKLQQW